MRLAGRVAMLDCGRVNALRLRFPNNEPADLELRPGVHAIGRDADGLTTLVPPGAALARFCVDRRGVWLQVGEGVRGLHVNGRPVRRMAMLRAGDAVYVDGAELLLLGAAPLPAPPGALTADPQAAAPPASNAITSDPAASDPRVVVRGVGGSHHGRSFTLAQARRVGCGAGCDIRLGESTAGKGPVRPQHTPSGHAPLEPGQLHAHLERHPDGVLLHTTGGHSAVVNGHRVSDALLRAGDQVVFDAQQRFIVEAPLGRSDAVGGPSPHPIPKDAEVTDAVPQPRKGARSMRRMPLLLLAAALLSAALSLLLMYGAR